MQTLDDNPLTFSAVVKGVALAVLALAAYYMAMTPEEMALWTGLVLALCLLLDWWVARRTTVLSRPEDKTGMPLSGPNGEPTQAQARSGKVSGKGGY